MLSPICCHLGFYSGYDVTLHSKISQPYEGVTGSSTSEGDPAGVNLKDVKDITAPGSATQGSIIHPICQY